ncbi:MAG: hypothetical protein NC111_03760 [Bacteroides sp.]|nr:hypothetical protein [Bacteroides sp.]MCM1471627.1 hypothetical protein [Bacteroides sp.]
MLPLCQAKPAQRLTASNTKEIRHASLACLHRSHSPLCSLFVRPNLRND